MENNFIRLYDGTDHYYDAKYNLINSSLQEEIKAYVIADCFDEQDIHYFRKPNTLKK